MNNYMKTELAQTVEKGYFKHIFNQSVQMKRKYLQGR
jgi:hypothetical protein